MSNSRTLDNALKEVLSDIRDGLADKIRKAVNVEIDIIRKSKGLNKLIEKKKEIEQAIENLRKSYEKKEKELENRIFEVKREIDKLDGISDEQSDMDTDKILNVASCSYRPTISQVQAAKKILRTIEAKNYFNFLQIEKNTHMMYDLAVTAKEKRSIILSIQTRNWRELGIEIPQLPFMEKFEIEKGQIIVPTLPLIEGAK